MRREEFEATYQALLEDIRPTDESISAVLRMGLWHLCYFPTLWTLTIESVSRASRYEVKLATWQVLDGFLKSVPLLALPLLRGKASELLEHFVPWSEVVARGERWPLEMVESWRLLFPSDVFEAISSRVRQLYSGEELVSHHRQKESIEKGKNSAEDAGPARREELEKLRTLWDSLDAAVAPTSRIIKKELKAEAVAPLAVTNTKDTAIVVEDEEYRPETSAFATGEKIIYEDEVQEGETVRKQRERRKRPRKD